MYLTRHNCTVTGTQGVHYCGFPIAMKAWMGTSESLPSHVCRTSICLDLTSRLGQCWSVRTMMPSMDITVELVGLNWSGFRQDQLPRTVSWLIFLTDTDSYWIGKPSKAVGREKGNAEGSYRLDGAREREGTSLGDTVLIRKTDRKERDRWPEGRSESQIWPRVCLFNATPSDPNVEQIVLMILETERNTGRGNDRRSGDNVRKGSVYGLDQFLLDIGYWIGCVLDRVGLTGRKAVEELNGGFGASVGSSERTREREYVSGCDGYAVRPETAGGVMVGLDSVLMYMAQGSVLLVLDGIEGCGADCVLTDPGVIRDWFWDTKHG
ncbi:hypothetical protein F2Q68_00005488 [Brassica cretica]|uniref:Uncharacterized protein n=1 Tax=Brassica cretica TaxID=69181 RepID=A0A8S9J6P9_BRACR|nr:hypothetical protein F2Q68_00005488 [Brassica cretica]